MQYIILYIILAAICLPGIKINDVRNENVVSIQSKVNLLRGVFAIFIIYTHCSMVVSPLPLILFPLRKVSTFGVGFFFVLSGYGLAYSFNKKNNYLDGFLYKKISKILTTAVVSRIIAEVVLHFSIGDELSIGGIFKYMNWYIYSLIVLYILFYLVYKFSTKRLARTIGIWSATVILTFAVLSYVNNVHDIGRSYYISQWAFAMGLSIYEYRDELDDLLKHHIIMTNIIMVICLGVTFALAMKANEYTVLDLLSHNLMLFPFFYFVMIICRDFTFDNPVLRFLNRISFEIYLYQFMILSMLKEILPTINVLYFIYAVIGTVVIAWAVNEISGLCREKFSNKA